MYLPCPALGRGVRPPWTTTTPQYDSYSYLCLQSPAPPLGILRGRQLRRMRLPRVRGRRLRPVRIKQPGRSIPQAHLRSRPADAASTAASAASATAHLTAAPVPYLPHLHQRQPRKRPSGELRGRAGRVQLPAVHLQPGVRRPGWRGRVRRARRWGLHAGAAAVEGTLAPY